MPEREVERERSRGDHLAAHLGALVAHAHDRALAELALDLRERSLKGGVARLGGLLLVGHGHGLAPPVRDGECKLEPASDGTVVRIAASPLSTRASATRPGTAGPRGMHGSSSSRRPAGSRPCGAPTITRRVRPPSPGKPSMTRPAPHRDPPSSRARLHLAGLLGPPAASARAHKASCSSSHRAHSRHGARACARSHPRQSARAGKGRRAGKHAAIAPGAIKSGTPTGASSTPAPRTGLELRRRQLANSCRAPNASRSPQPRSPSSPARTAASRSAATAPGCAATARNRPVQTARRRRAPAKKKGRSPATPPRQAAMNSRPAQPGGSSTQLEIAS